jgi:hypothetical protein
MCEACKGCTEWALMYDRERTKCADLRRQLEVTRRDLADSTAQLELDNEECVALRRQLAEARERAEKAERAFALQRATCETESFREQIRSQLIRDGIEAQATMCEQCQQLQARVAQLEGVLRKISSWLVCYTITTDLLCTCGHPKSKHPVGYNEGCLRVGCGCNKFEEMRQKDG